MVNHLLSMSKLSFLLISVAITLLIADYATAAGAPTKPDFFDYACVNTTGNYTASSAYQANLISVLVDLQSNASIASFHNASAGLGADTVYGQYYCRGDIDSILCSDCIQQAALSLLGNCTFFKTAAIWYEECTLRYSNQSMVGIEAIRPLTGGFSTKNVTDSVALLTVLQETFNGLINESTQGIKPSLFATGEGVVSTFETAYCLVQCSPDLNATQCDSCLHLAYSLVSTWGLNNTMPVQIAVFFASCQLRYSAGDPFYAVKNAPPPPPGTPPSPPSPVSSGLTNPLTPTTISTNTTNTTPTKGTSVVLRSSGVGVVTTALTLLMLLVKM